MTLVHYHSFQQECDARASKPIANLMLARVWIKAASAWGAALLLHGNVTLPVMQ